MGKLSAFNDKIIAKLFKYSDKYQRNELNFSEFLTFFSSFIQCYRSFRISERREKENTFIDRKVQLAVEIMNIHFKEHEISNNQEISFEELKKSLIKEVDLFKRSEVTLILKKINPDANFEFWKFDQVLREVYTSHFDFDKLYNEDKVYKFLVRMFSQQDVERSGLLHYKKIKYCFKKDKQFKLNKIQVMTILGLMNIKDNEYIDYKKASILFRLIIQELFTSAISMQTIELSNKKLHVFNRIDDEFDEHEKKIKHVVC